MSGADQWYDGIAVATGSVPQELSAFRAMWAAAMTAGIDDARRYLAGAHRRAPGGTAEGYREVRWLFDDADHVGSACWLCDLFDLDVSRVRGAVLTRAGVSRQRVDQLLGISHDQCAA